MKIDDEAGFGHRLREVRIGRGVTQKALARATGIHPTAIGRMERGEREPRLTTILRLARGLDVPPEELVKGLTAGDAFERDRELAALGRAIRRLRHDRGLSMASLAHLAGVSPANLGRIELGQANPALMRTLYPLSVALGVMLSELFLAAEVEAADGGDA